MALDQNRRLTEKTLSMQKKLHEEKFIQLERHHIANFRQQERKDSNSILFENKKT